MKVELEKSVEFRKFKGRFIFDFKGKFSYNLNYVKLNLNVYLIMFECKVYLVFYVINFFFLFINNFINCYYYKFVIFESN